MSAEAARRSDTEQAWQRPPLEVVTHDPVDPATPAPTVPEEPRIGRSALAGAILGFAVVSTGVTALGLASGTSGASAVAFGGFVGMWGGVGFGFMMGATVPLARHMNAGHATRSVAAPHATATGETE